MHSTGGSATMQPQLPSGSLTTVPATSLQLPKVGTTQALPTAQLAAGWALAVAPALEAKLVATIEGGSAARPMTTMSGSDCGVAGSPAGGRKKLACKVMSSEISVQPFAAHSEAVV